MAVNLNEPMSWPEFKNLGKDDQREYLQHLIDTYGANAVSFAEMFHVGAQAVRKYMADADLGIALNRGRRVDRVRWNEFLGIGDAEGQGAPAEAGAGMQIRSTAMRFEGKIDVDVIADSLRKIFDGQTVGEIEITCTISGANRPEE